MHEGHENSETFLTKTSTKNIPDQEICNLFAQAFVKLKIATLLTYVS